MSWDKETRDFVRGYRLAMVWANTYREDGESLDFPFGDATETAREYARKIGPITRNRMYFDCVSFLSTQVLPFPGSESLRALIRDLADSRGYTFEQAGHDFALTRNHHGAGFWDRGLGADGDVLTRCAEAYGESSLYFDGKTITGE